VNAPLHTFRAVRLPQPADVMHRRLTTDPQALAVASTAEALQDSAPLLRSWGLVASALPTVDASVTGVGELGSISLRWFGDEATTGWPAMSARLLVTPTGPTASELTLATTRAPALGLAASQLFEHHRHQAVDVNVAGFLRAVADHLQRVPARPLERTGAVR
jgi:hypothetical protein